MDKEIKKRIIRIIIVSLFLIILSISRNNVKESFEQANELLKEMPTFIVTQLDSNYYNLGEEYKVEIKNVSTGKEKVSFVLNSTSENSIPYNYMNYEIIKNDISVKQGIVKTDGVIYKDTISKNAINTYKIKFWIEEEKIKFLDKNEISAQLLFV